MTPKLAKERDETRGVKTPGSRLEPQLRLLPVPTVAERDRDGSLLPIEGMNQDWGLTPWRPGTADYRLLRDPAFVSEDDPGAAPPCVFFTLAQRLVTHSPTAASLRSRARLAGR